MASNARRYPHAVEGLVWLGGPRLTALAEATKLSLKGVHPSPGARAALLRDKLPSPEALRPHLSAEDYDILADHLHVGKRSTWKNPDLVFEEAVFAKLFHEAAAEVAPSPQSKQSARDPSTTEEWPELHGIEAWVCLDDARQHNVATALAKRVGPRVTVLEPTRINRFPRLQDPTTGWVWIAIVGDSFEMGLSTSDKQALTRLTKGWSEEAKMHVRDFAAIARPTRKVFVPPFLCAEMPVTAKQGQDAPGVAVAGEVCLFEPSAAVRYAEQRHARMLSEVEWEYVARQRDSRAWLSMEDDSRQHDPRKFVENALNGGLERETGFLFGVRGLGWGTWVEDSWHSTYEGAPDDARSWDPHAIPEVVRGGAYLSWPWQMDGEALLLHAAHRERKSKGNFPLLLARNLPSRSNKKH